MCGVVKWRQFCTGVIRWRLFYFVYIVTSFAELWDRVCHYCKCLPSNCNNHERDRWWSCSARKPDTSCPSRLNKKFLTTVWTVKRPGPELQSRSLASKCPRSKCDFEHPELWRTPVSAVWMRGVYFIWANVAHRLLLSLCLCHGDQFKRV